MLDLSFNFNDDADYDFNALSAGGSAASISGSSYASSSFGPHTPTSGRSTPPFSGSFDFGSSFASSVDSVPLDLTPPCSATSTHFPMTPKTDIVLDLAYPMFPFTPSRGQLDFSAHPLSNCGTQLTPSQTMDCSFMVNHLGSQLPLSTPSGMTQFDAATHWIYPDSPISFDQQSPARLGGTVQLTEQEPRFIKRKSQDDGMRAPLTLSSCAARRRVLMGEARHRTTALQQQVPQCSPSPAPTRIKREKKAGAGVRGQKKLGFGGVVPPNRFPCPVEGCDRRYRRKEHMNRHVNSKHGVLGESLYPCPCCDHVANRFDNVRPHLELHAQPRSKTGGGKPRVEFHPRAAHYLAEMDKMDKKGRRKAKSKKRASSPA